MAASKFTEENCAGFVDLVADGATTEEAARKLGIRAKTIKDWLTRGRRDGDGPYAEFAAAVEEARTTYSELHQAEMTEAELRGHVAAAVRAGNVRAMELMAKMLKASSEDSAPAEDGFDALDAETDELSERRARRAS